MTETPRSANNVLMDNIDKHDVVLLIAFNKSGKPHIDTNRPTFEFVNYALNRAAYNINQLENVNILEAEQNAERSIEDQVADNMTSEPPKKRGRPAKVKI